MAYKIGKYRVKNDPFERIEVYRCKLGGDGNRCGAKYIDIYARLCRAGEAIKKGDHLCDFMVTEILPRISLWQAKPDLLIELESGLFITAKELELQNNKDILRM